MSLVNDGKHIPSILDRTTCKKHGAQEGDPCWHVYPGSTRGGKGLLYAICNSRVKRAGYNGTVAPSSLRLNRNNKANPSKKEVKS